MVCDGDGQQRAGEPCTLYNLDAGELAAGWCSAQQRGRRIDMLATSWYRTPQRKDGLLVLVAGSGMAYSVVVTRVSCAGADDERTQRYRCEVRSPSADPHPVLTLLRALVRVWCAALANEFLPYRHTDER